MITSGLSSLDQVARLEGVGGGAHHLDVGLRLEDVGEDVADHARIVDDEDRGSHGSLEELRSALDRAVDEARAVVALAQHDGVVVDLAQALTITLPLRGKK